MTRKVLLSILMSLAFHHAQADNNLGHLDVRCKTDNASPGMQYEAGKMAYALYTDLKKLINDRKKEGRSLQVVLVARAGLDSKSTRLIRDTINGQPFTLEDMARDLKTRAKGKETKKNILARDYLEPQNSDRNLSYTHVGFLIYSRSEAEKEITEGRARIAQINAENNTNLEYKYDPDLVGWRFVHLLSPCNKNLSRIYNEGVATFFLDDPSEYKALVIVPTDEIQGRIVDVINNTTITNEDRSDVSWSLKPPTYNLIAPLSRVEEGNSNTWPLYVLALAIRGIESGTYREANSILQELGYRPSKVQLGGKYALFNNTVAKPFLPKALNFRKEDHPLHGDEIIEINSAIALKDFMERNNAVDHVREVFSPKGPLQAIELEVDIRTEN